MEKSNRSIIFFVIGFLGIVAAYYLFINLVGERFFDGYISMTSRIAAFLLSIFEESAYSKGPIIGDLDNYVVLSFGCEGTEPIVVYLAGVLSFPALWKYRIKGAIIGLILLYTMNIIRVVVLFYIAKNYSNQFELFHITIFPVLFIFFAILSWAIWARSIKKKGN